MPPNRNPLTIIPPPSTHEAAAITAAILAYLDTQSTPSQTPTPTTSPWRLAGRLESQRLPITPATLTGRWRL